MNATTTTASGLRRLAAAAVIAGAAALAGSALGDPAGASAAPREWDIGEYDQCIADGYGEGLTQEEWDNHEALCCWASGGDLVTTKDGEGSKCVAPPAKPAVAGPGVVAPPPVVATQPPPPPPVVRNPGAITPGPVGPG